MAPDKPPAVDPKTLSSVRQMLTTPDADRVRTGRERLTDAAEREGDPAVADAVAAALDEQPTAQLLDTIFTFSPFLTHCLVVDPTFATQLFTGGYTSALDAVFTSITNNSLSNEKEDTVARALRIARRRAALTIGFADISGEWGILRVTEALSDFAEHAINATAAKLLHDAHVTGEIILPDPCEPCRNSGFIVLGMGKLGGRELNYSSDVDLILLFEPELVDYRGHRSPQEFFVYLGQRLVKVLEEHTGNGYVFRTDLRLRPDPGSTPLVIPTPAAEAYYESMGQNWERAAMIKARPVAGDIKAGETFLDYLRPFVWRKSLDFYAIQDIHSIKRQIYAQRGGDAIAVAGHNIKLGRGGIREIELYAQTQQLIWGGREPDLRTSRTCNALEALAAANHIEANTASALIEAYEFLRTVEHRLQMIDDQQTHTIPNSPDHLDKFALFMGFQGIDAFSTKLSARLHTVEDHYAELFEEAPILSGLGTLAFTGSDDHPDTLATLSSMGFCDPLSMSAVVRKWHHGRYRATRSARARELLTELTPSLLDAFSKTLNPDAALLRFNDFLAGLAAGVQMFSLFYSNPPLLTLLAEIMGSTPRLAETLRKHPILFDSVLSANFFERPADGATLSEDFDVALSQARDFEDVLSILCRQVNDRMFQIGVHILSGRIKPADSGRPLSDIADTTIAKLYLTVETEWAERHGRFTEGDFGVVALGKLGGQELTLGSDLDLCFVFHSNGQTQSDGGQPLSPMTYYNRLGQRFLGALTAPTGAGHLYKVDMRLRPTGSVGPLASSSEAFHKYYIADAWTWEHMALTRARVVCTAPALANKIEDTIRTALTAQRDAGKLLRDVSNMRIRIERERPTQGAWDVKNRRGGLIDIEFIAQYLQLRHACENSTVLSTNTTNALNNLSRAGYLSLSHAGRLIAAMTFWRNLQGAMRLSVGDELNEKTITEASREMLANSCAIEDFITLKQKLVDSAADVYAIFRELIEEPAANLMSN